MMSRKIKTLILFVSIAVLIGGIVLLVAAVFGESFAIREICGMCGGDGWFFDELCAVCHGSGYETNQVLEHDGYAVLGVLMMVISLCSIGILWVGWENIPIK